MPEPHPLFVFDQFGDLERCALRPGNVHSAEGWRSGLEPVIARYRGRGLVEHFRGDAAFAKPELHELLTDLTRPAGRTSKFYNGRGTAEQWIKEGKLALPWTRLSCRTFRDNAVRPQLFALACNLADFLRTLALPREIGLWSLTSLREKPIKIGARTARHGRYVVFQLAEASVPRALSAATLHRIDRPRPRPPPPARAPRVTIHANPKGEVRP